MNSEESDLIKAREIVDYVITWSHGKVNKTIKEEMIKEVALMLVMD